MLSVRREKQSEKGIGSISAEADEWNPKKKQGINLEYEIQPNTHFPAYKTHERARSHMCAV